MIFAVYIGLKADNGVFWYVVALYNLLSVMLDSLKLYP